MKKKNVVKLENFKNDILSNRESFAVQGGVKPIPTRTQYLDCDPNNGYACKVHSDADTIC